MIIIIPLIDCIQLASRSSFWLTPLFLKNAENEQKDGKWVLAELIADFVSAL